MIQHRSTATKALACLMGGALMISATSARADWIFAGQETNDLYQTAKSSGLATRRADTPAAAVAQAKAGDGILILADDYPARQTPVPDEVYQSAAARKLRLYVEYPAALPNLRIEAPRKMNWERAVVTSEAFGPTLAKMPILMIQDCTYLPMAATKPHLVLARVAGFDEAKQSSLRLMQRRRRSAAAPNGMAKDACSFTATGEI